MKLCPNRSAAEERSLKRGLLPSHGRIRRGAEGSSRQVDGRRSWDPRVETTTGTPCLEEMPITNGRRHRPLKTQGLDHDDFAKPDKGAFRVLIVMGRCRETVCLRSAR